MDVPVSALADDVLLRWCSTANDVPLEARFEAYLERFADRQLPELTPRHRALQKAWATRDAEALEPFLAPGDPDEIMDRRYLTSEATRMLFDLWEHIA